MSKYLFIFLTIIVLVILQIAFLPGLNIKLPIYINLPLLLIIFLIFFYDTSISLSGALLAGLLFDFYAVTFFGFYILLFLTIFIFIKFFSLYVLQNKNLFVFIFLNIIGILTWYLLTFIIIILKIKFGDYQSNIIFNSIYFLNILYQLITHVFIIFLLYKFFPRLKSILSGALVN